MVKKVSFNCQQSPTIDEEARIRHRHQSLLQDYLELQKVWAFILLFFLIVLFLCPWGLFFPSVLCVLKFLLLKSHEDCNILYSVDLSFF